MHVNSLAHVHSLPLASPGCCWPYLRQVCIEKPNTTWSKQAFVFVQPRKSHHLLHSGQDRQCYLLATKELLLFDSLCQNIYFIKYIAYLWKSKTIIILLIKGVCCGVYFELVQIFLCGLLGWNWMIGIWHISQILVAMDWIKSFWNLYVGI